MEEIDETKYWLEVILEANLSNNKELLKALELEANEITRIMSTARNSIYRSKKNEII